MHELIATVLEKAAAYIEAVEGTKEAQVREERMTSAKALATKVSEVTGESLDEEMVDKLANADKDVLSAISRLTQEAVDDEMGQPSQTKTAGVPMTGKEAVAAAEESFLNFILSP
jgi:hypothetical protein